MNLRRFDTLFLRLFVLMWVTLVASHYVAFSAVRVDGPPAPPGLPTMGTLPPPDLPARGAALDYAVRAAVMALGALLGARWLSAPMRRLARAADGLADGLAHGRPPAPLDEDSGTAEVRATARVFNAMARRLQQQFDARGLQMAALSHDLRTPLTRLRMRLEDAPPALAEGARADVHQMTEMVEATLAVLREQRDGAPPAPLELRSLLQAIADDHAGAGADVTLADGPPLRACVRPAALRRIVDNLVGNALRHGGSARLALSAAGGWAEITVDDDGPGIAPAQIERAFEPWVQLGGSAAGHGLGLAIARDLAGREGGTLALANRAGGGLRATLRLPSNVSAPTTSV